MDSNKALLGLFVVLFILVLTAYFFRDRLNTYLVNSFNIISPITTEQEATPSGTVAGSNDGEISPEATSSVMLGTSAAEQPQMGGSQTHMTCTAEILAQDCSAVEQVPVCGYERIEAGKGISSTRSMTFPSACHYCQLYGEDSELSLGDESYSALGYESGACTQ